ncbi:MAG: putative Se/S carrier-like protein [Sphaerochaetaceae bacterium]
MTIEFWVTFFCHYDALMFQQQCRQRGLSCRLSSAPRSLSSSCGTAAMVLCDGKIDFFPKAEGIFVKNSDGTFSEVGGQGMEERGAETNGGGR